MSFYSWILYAKFFDCGESLPSHFSALLLVDPVICRFPSGLTIELESKIFYVPGPAVAPKMFSSIDLDITLATEGHSAKNDLSMEVLRDFCSRETFLRSVPEAKHKTLPP
jgi:hypothetical protein